MMLPPCTSTRSYPLILVFPLLMVPQHHRNPDPALIPTALPKGPHQFIHPILQLLDQRQSTPSLYAANSFTTSHLLSTGYKLSMRQSSITRRKEKYRRWIRNSRIRFLHSKVNFIKKKHPSLPSTLCLAPGCPLPVLTPILINIHQSYPFSFGFLHTHLVPISIPNPSIQLPPSIRAASLIYESNHAFPCSKSPMTDKF